ncbi:MULTISPECIES: cortex morphogenetic protein CmpA [Shouchella]|uniref:Cortex morphogenetic protein CmpA n=1 Tax=Shouchella lehensis TaxID=300825 RepID=A0A4Y7WDY8_9BACI|nr:MULTISPECIES: cortex morphogenetic protein CmpA [Bacillaceae]RQW18432.1 cortex morphogenetic protein CmpA [Bacillus sp. C1-1]TES46152.1 cortex morphogenetic protein CmpA [Shouchella lehensis]
MPTWLQNQLKKAYSEKNRHQVKVLNQCWFYYRSTVQSRFNNKKTI